MHRFPIWDFSCLQIFLHFHKEVKLWEKENRAVPLLNADQKSVFNEVESTVLPGVTADDLNAAVSRAQSTISKAFFLDASAGTGKTCVTRALHAFLRLHSRNS